MAEDKKAELAVKSPVLEKINSQKQAIGARLPKGIDREKFVLGIMTAVRRSKVNAKPGHSLADCDPQSVLLAACEAAEVGCSLAPSLQLGWLIPYDKEAQFQPSYRFFIQKAYETKEVKTFFAEIVYKGDKFIREYAPKKNLFHAPGDDASETDRSLANALGAYAFIEFTDGTIDWEWLTKEQIDRHRKHSKQPNSLMWTSFWEEGWRKSPIRVLAKRLPLKNRDFEGLVEMINNDAGRDLVSVDDISNLPAPAEPRRLSQPEKTTENQPAQEKEKPAETKTKNGGSNKDAQAPQAGSMFAEGEDPFLSPAQIKEFWDTVFAAGWRKAEASKHLNEKFNISEVKDIHQSQLAKILAEFEAPEPGADG